MNSEPFLTPRLIGPRFEGGVIPLAVLGDLAVLEAMFVDVAKWKYRENNPDRKRVPRRFADGMTLKLTGVEEGSARPLINLFVAASTLLPTPAQHYFEQARDAIIGAIGAAERGADVRAFLPPDLLAYFNRFGRSLEQGEAVEFTQTADGKPVRLTRETRRTLVLASSAEEFTEEIVLDGAIPEADQKANSFHFLLRDGTKLKAPLTDEHFGAVMEAFNNYKKGARVRMYAGGRFDRSNRLQGIEAVEHIFMLDPLDVAARVEELGSLKDGWLDGKGVAPTREGLRWFLAAFDRHFPDDTLLPYLYPTAEGGIRMEWTARPHELSVEIDLRKRAGDWHLLNLDSDAEESRTLDLGAQQDWDWLGGEVRRLVGGNA